MEDEAPRLTPEDRLEIHELYATYARGADTEEDDGRVWAEVFTPDGRYHNGANEYVGHEALRKYITREKVGVDRERGIHYQHWINNIVLRPTPEGATGSLYVMVLLMGAESPVGGRLPVSIVAMGTCRDELVRTPEGWRIKSRISSPVPAPLRES